MKDVLIRAELLSPSSISTERQARSPSSLDYISGATLRGAIAKRYLETFGIDPDFERLFLDEEVIFPNLYPSNKEGNPGYILPLTAMACKRDKGHGIEDTLYLKGALAMSYTEEGILPEDIDASYYRCKICEQDLRPIQGYWNGNVENPQIIKAAKSIRLHTGIDRATGTVAEGILYGIEALNSKDNDGRKTLLSGYAQYPDSLMNKLTRLLSEPLFIGRAKTRGYGEISLTFEESHPYRTLDASRLKKWDEAFKAYCDKLGLTPDSFYFAITLQSDAILLDRFLRSTPEIDLGFEGIECIIRIVKMITVRGWNAAHRLPKEDEGAVLKGSTYIFRYQGNHLDALFNRLQILEDKGVGVRRNEGFGRVTISSPFHLNFAIRRNNDT